MAPTTRNLNEVPAHAPGAGVAEVLRRSEKWLKSDAIAFGDTTPMNLVELPGNVLITGGFVSVETAFDASGTSAAATATLTVPNATGTLVLYDAASVGLQATGLHPCTAAELVPSSGGFAIFNYTAGTTTAGQARVYLSYVTLEDKL